jgi:hypothetical protein
MARSIGNIPEDWTITIVESKRDKIRMMCAAWAITPDMLATQQHPKTQLNLLPEGLAKPVSVMLTVAYHHIDENRKPVRAHVWMRKDLDEPEQGLPERWIRDVLTGRDYQEAWVICAPDE